MDNRAQLLKEEYEACRKDNAVRQLLPVHLVVGLATACCHVHLWWASKCTSSPSAAAAN
jgi:hypothetical protein